MIKKVWNYLVAQFSTKPPEKPREESDPKTLELTKKLTPFPEKFGRMVYDIQNNVPGPENPTRFVNAAGWEYDLRHKPQSD